MTRLKSMSLKLYHHRHYPQDQQPSPWPCTNLPGLTHFSSNVLTALLATLEDPMAYLNAPLLNSVNVSNSYSPIATEDINYLIFNPIWMDALFRSDFPCAGEQWQFTFRWSNSHGRNLVYGIRLAAFFQVLVHKLSLPFPPPLSLKLLTHPSHHSTTP